jgi:hypothetical protein
VALLRHLSLINLLKAIFIHKSALTVWSSYFASQEVSEDSCCHERFDCLLKFYKPIKFADADLPNLFCRSGVWWSILWCLLVFPRSKFKARQSNLQPWNFQDGNQIYLWYLFSHDVPLPHHTQQFQYFDMMCAYHILDFSAPYLKASWHASWGQFIWKRCRIIPPWSYPFSFMVSIVVSRLIALWFVLSRLQKGAYSNLARRCKL